MTPRYFFQPPGWLALLAISLWATTAAHAQTAPVKPTPQEKAATAQAASASFQSALDGYKPYTDEKISNWKEANDLTARIGGWRVYAKEARQPQGPEVTPQGDARAAPAKP